MHGWKKWLLIGVVGVAVILLPFAAIGALAAYANWHAERATREFCDETPIGSDISAAATRAEKKHLLWAGGRHNAGVGETVSPYTFYFFGFVMDKAVCEVSISREGKVRSKHSEMELDQETLGYELSSPLVGEDAKSCA